ncbi:MAG: alpha/beta hydrolase-fold protein [Bacteroidia bacterium]|nr:alpha/beta hydrolase-fold protein [Bacteroidia bacterium]
MAARITTKLSPKRPPLVLELATNGPDPRPVFITGNFNGWQTRDEAYRMHPVGGDRYRFQFPEDQELPDPLEYKYVRGDWDDEELDGCSHVPTNRTLHRPGGLIHDFAPRWKRRGVTIQEHLLPERVLLEENLLAPQLGRSRRIQVLLPHDYHSQDRHYPVLYLQDGQNLFDEHAPFGNWAIDRQLALLAEKNHHELIVVAIDHTNEYRIEEFSPYPTSRIPKARGRAYARFKAHTLKPFIDKQFRTLTEARFTGVGGSSMGGLISLYTGLRHPEVFGRWMIFSPSLWVSNQIYEDVLAHTLSPDLRAYLYAGGVESRTMVPAAQRLRDLIIRQSRRPEQVFLSIDPRGRHHEPRWGQEFPEAVSWLFFPAI